MKSTKKKLNSKIQFALIILVSAIFGAVLGGFLLWAGKDISNLSQRLMSGIAQILLPAWGILWLIMAGTAFVLYRKSKAKMLAFAQNPDEEGEDEGSKLLSVGMLINCINMILSFGIYGISLSMGELMENGELLGCLGLFILTMTFCVGYEIYSVGLTKRCQPEKQGDPLEIGFEKDWMKSCDEAERAIIHAAAYKTFQLLRFVIIGLWVVAALGAMYLNMGVIPMIFITVIWLAHSVGYMVYAMSGRKK